MAPTTVCAALLALALPLGAQAFQRTALPVALRPTWRASTTGCTLRMAAEGFALLFDCDGVLADTERDGHRIAFNDAFVEKGIELDWTIELYGELLRVGGGKERMTAHWNKVGWPAGYEDKAVQQQLVKELHLRKTELFNLAISAGSIPLRPGVLSLIDEAIAADVPIGVCSTSNDKAVTNLVETLMGMERRAKIQIFAGDVVEKKKPSPDIYNLAKDTMGLDPAKTMVIEDSHIGLSAAKAAGMNCLVTKSSYTAGEDFSKADRIVDDLVAGGVSLDKLTKMAGL